MIASAAVDVFETDRDLASRKASPPPEARRRNPEVPFALGAAVLDALHGVAGDAR